MVVDRLNPIVMSVSNASDQKENEGSNMGNERGQEKKRYRVTHAGHHLHVRKCLSLLRRHHADFGGTVPNGRETQI